MAEKNTKANTKSKTAVDAKAKDKSKVTVNKAANNKKTSVKSKSTNNTKNKVKKKKNIKIKLSRKKVNPKVLSVVAFLSSILLIISSYAWLSASLNVRIKFFDVVVSSDSGLFISLDGVNFSESVTISLETVITELRNNYPNHTNQWAAGGLWPVSSNGIRNSNMNKFDVYIGELTRFNGKIREEKKFLNTKLMKETEANSANIYIAFDIFLKNVSGSPKSDNLYLNPDTFIDFEEDTDDETKESMSNIMNSMRFGVVKIGSVAPKSSVEAIQNIQCNNKCEMFIYEPNSTLHSAASVEKARTYGITLVDGVYTPTYAVINEGTRLQHTNGHPGTGFPLDTEHFALQRTITEDDFATPIFKIPNGFTKLRAYVWIEGQDIDSLETNSKGAAIYIVINFEKDLAGYE